MKSMLNAILRGLMRRSDTIGKVHTGTKLVETVPSKTGTAVSSVKLPAGTYVVTGCVSWRESNSVLTVYSLVAGKTSSLIAEVRGTMSAGGGDCVSAIVSFDTETTVRLDTYQNTDGTVPVSLVSLKAVRIK